MRITHLGALFVGPLMNVGSYNVSITEALVDVDLGIVYQTHFIGNIVETMST
jgi:hypothetical protein